MKVGASKGVIRVDLEEETWPGGGFRATRKPLDTPLSVAQHL